MCGATTVEDVNRLEQLDKWEEQYLRSLEAKLLADERRLATQLEAERLAA